MGAQHAARRTSTTVGVRATATAAAVVALTGAGTGIASAYGCPDGAPSGRQDRVAGRDGCARDGVVDHLTDAPLAAVGLFRDATTVTCADTASFDEVSPDTSSATDGPADDRVDDAPAPVSSGQDPSRPAERTAGEQQSPLAPQSAATRPAARAQPKQPSSIDTPPPLGQTRMIKLPTAR